MLHDLLIDCADLTEATQLQLRRAAPLLRERGRARPEVAVRCNLRGASAGQFRRHRDGRLEIRYNLAMARQQPKDFIAETVPHEVAHLVAWLLFGDRIKPHGPQWQSVMRYLGVAEPKRCHQFELAAPARRQRRWHYRCDCREHQLSSTRHNRARRGQVYVCATCGKPLRPQG